MAPAATGGAGGPLLPCVDGMADPLLDDLNPEQRRAVLTVDGPLLVIAGAGSGKTRVLTHRIAHLVRDHDVRASEIIAITFTNRAAGEMADRVGRLLGGRARGMWVMTFHAACARLLRARGRAHRLPAGLLHLRLGRPGAGGQGRAGDRPRQGLRSATRRAACTPASRTPRTAWSGPQEFRAQVNGFFDQTVADVYDRYQARLQQAGAMDFDDLLVNTVRLLEDVPDVREHWTRAFRYVLVDEYQDTNHAQYRIVRALASQLRQRLRRRRLRPVDLLLARRRHPQHARLREATSRTP